MKRYEPKVIEPKWQKIWEETNVYTADLDSDKPKYIGMSMFNYPSGAGIHIGHAMNYTISDVKARMKRQQGYESYHPVGWDSFGLPAENYAIKAGVSPQESMGTIIPNYHKQYKAMGWSNDWEKEIASHRPEYYKWTQWIFSEMYRAGLAYQEERQQWWCNQCQTVLANEQVIEGKCWRHDGPDDPLVEKKGVNQWFFKITDYADELLEAIDDLDWTEAVKTAQRNWIGRSEGAEIEFDVYLENKPNFVILHGFTGRANKEFIPWLKESLEAKGFKVQAPQMPNTDNPVEEEQVNYVLENCEFDEHTVLIGHSLGGAVAMKVLQKLTHSIEKLLLVAPVIEPAFRPENYKQENPNKVRTFVDTFDLTYNYQEIIEKTSKIVVLSEEQEGESRRPYLVYLSEQLKADFYETVGNKRHFTGDKEPFILKHTLSTIRVFTTRPDTIFGATFMVIAPESDLVDSLTTNDQKKEVDNYRKKASLKTEVERQASKEKSGVFTGTYAVNPANGEKIPIWVADYVLGGYGTGAIMAVPAHDERDNEFAKKFGIPIIPVVEPTAGEAQGDDTHKDSIFVALRKPKTNEVLVLDWGPRRERHGGFMLIGGGIEEGETPEEAAIREIAEETGYTDIELVEKTDFKGHGYFYSNTKNKNMHASGYGLLFDLKSDVRQEDKLDQGEKGKFTVTWQPISKVASMLDDRIHETMYRKLVLGECYTGTGVLINSADFDGTDSKESIDEITDWLAKDGKAEKKINYKMRDWSVSRQRYWGAPIPIVHCSRECGTVLIPDDQLPVILPELEDFAPSGDGRSALARATDWLKTTCPDCGADAERETDTLDTYICSSWYMLRYLDPHNQEEAFSSDRANKWMPIDFYNGGDHATAHMLYARFVTRFFAKQGKLENPEPFKQFLFNGKVRASDGSAFSKSKGNGVDPLEIINSGYGADALRVYLMFAGPLELDSKWDPDGVPGAYRFLTRLYTLAQEYIKAKESEIDTSIAKNVRLAEHTMIKKVSEDIEHNSYNTAIASLMKCLNEYYDEKPSLAKNDVWQSALESIVMCVAPFAPHLADELWQDLGHSDSVQKEHWPEFNEAYLVQDTITLAVQVNGKVRAEIEVSTDATEVEIKAQAVAQENVSKYLNGKEPKKMIYVKNRLVSIVV